MFNVLVIRNDIIIIDVVSVYFKIFLLFLYFIVSKILKVILMIKSNKDVIEFINSRIVNGYC